LAQEHRMTVPDVHIRPLRGADAERCDQIIASLPYHFGQEDGRRECADAVRSQPGLVAMLDHAVVGFILARDLPSLWPNDTAVLFVKPLPQAH
jgi:hypothetical protein